MHCTFLPGHYTLVGPLLHRNELADHHLAGRQSRAARGANLAEENIIWQQIVIVHSLVQPAKLYFLTPVEPAKQSIFRPGSSCKIVFLGQKRWPQTWTARNLLKNQAKNMFLSFHAILCSFLFFFLFSMLFLFVLFLPLVPRVLTCLGGSKEPFQAIRHNAKLTA